MGMSNRGTPHSEITMTVHPSNTVQQNEELERQIAAQDYSDLRLEAEKRLEYQLSYSQALLQSLTIANGGALVALFSLVGALQSNQTVSLLKNHLWISFVAFSIGLATNLLATVGGFFSQMYFYNAAMKQGWNAQSRALGLKREDPIENEMTKGNLAMVLGTLSAFVSIIAFIVGCGFALSAVTI